MGNNKFEGLSKAAINTPTKSGSSADDIIVLEVLGPHGYGMPFCPDSSVLEEQTGKLCTPGPNGITRRLWDMIKDRKVTKDHIAASVIKMHGEGVPQPLVKDWDKISLPKAQKVIGAMTELEQVNAVRKHTKKKSLLKLLDDRIEAILKDNEGSEDE